VAPSPYSSGKAPDMASVLGEVSHLLSGYNVSGTAESSGLSVIDGYYILVIMCFLPSSALFSSFFEFTSARLWCSWLYAGNHPKGNCKLL
jgi:hypothetical protein